jgi:hypothetical protein
LPQIAVRLGVFILFASVFIVGLFFLSQIPFYVIESMPLEYKITLILAILVSFSLVLLSYWVYYDGKRIDALTEKLGVKEEETLHEDSGEICGNCKYYLSKKCPREYSTDKEIWRNQEPCELFIRGKTKK